MSRSIDMSDVTRWIASAVLVAGAHAAAAAIIVTYADPVAPGAPEAAIVVDLAPVAAAPEEAQPDVTPGPLAQQIDAPPEVEPDETVDETPAEKAVPREAVETAPEETPVALAATEPPEKKVETRPEPAPQEQPLVEAAPKAEKPEVTAVVPVRAPPSPPPPKKKKASRPMQLASAPMPAPQIDARATAPSQGMPSPASRQAALTWNSAISAALERAKRYPPEAKSRGEQGTAVVAFSVDRAGNVLSSRIARSSGSSILDQETLATVARASLPPAPAEHPGTRFSFSVPIRFNIR